MNDNDSEPASWFLLAAIGLVPVAVALAILQVRGVNGSMLAPGVAFALVFVLIALGVHRSGGRR